MPEIPYLTAADVAFLKEMANYYRNRRPEQLRGQVDEDEVLAPETYLAKTMGSGMSGLQETITYDRPGFGDCQVYRVIDAGPYTQLEPVRGLIKTVFNLSVDSIPANSWVPVTRDKFGTWIVLSATAASGDPSAAIAIVWTTSTTVTDGTQPGKILTYVAASDSWTVGADCRVKQSMGFVLKIEKRLLAKKTSAGPSGLTVYVTSTQTGSDGTQTVCKTTGTVANLYENGHLVSPDPV